MTSCLSGALRAIRWGEKLFRTFSAVAYSNTNQVPLTPPFTGNSKFSFSQPVQPADSLLFLLAAGGCGRLRTATFFSPCPGETKGMQMSPWSTKQRMNYMTSSHSHFLCLCFAICKMAMLTPAWPSWIWSRKERECRSRALVGDSRGNVRGPVHCHLPTHMRAVGPLGVAVGGG